MSTEEEATATREALHGLKWPSGNPKMLQVDFGIMDKVSCYSNSTNIIYRK